MQDPPNVAEPARRRREIAMAGHQRDESTARAALADPDPAARATALGALARMERLEPVDVADALHDPDPLVRRRAAELAARRAPEAVDLLPALDDPDSSVVEMAAWALGEQPREDDAALDKLIAVAGSHDDALCREAAVAALGAIGHRRGLPAILGATKDKPAVRRRAVLALAPFDGPDVDAALQAALTDRDWQVRQAAEDLLGD